MMEFYSRNYKQNKFCIFLPLGKQALWVLSLEILIHCITVHNNIHEWEEEEEEEEEKKGSIQAHVLVWLMATEVGYIKGML